MASPSWPPSCGFSLLVGGTRAPRAAGSPCPRCPAWACSCHVDNLLYQGHSYCLPVLIILLEEKGLFRKEWILNCLGVRVMVVAGDFQILQQKLWKTGILENLCPTV